MIIRKLYTNSDGTKKIFNEKNMSLQYQNHNLIPRCQLLLFLTMYFSENFCTLDTFNKKKLNTFKNTSFVSKKKIHHSFTKYPVPSISP